jgi:Holliday junction resolvase RusA-like endonuclease
MYLFEIHTKPVPQKQTKWCKNWAYDPSKADRQTVIWQASHYAPETPLLGPVEMDVMFYMPVPKSCSKSERNGMLNGLIYPIKRPDVDNMGYLISNALNELFYKDDSQIVDLHLHKRYAEVPRSVIKIIPLG